MIVTVLTAIVKLDIDKQQTNLKQQQTLIEILVKHPDDYTRD